MFLLTRILRGAVTLWVVATIIFFAVRASSDPVQYLLPPGLVGDERDEVRRMLGIDQDVFSQYVLYVKNLLSADFGRSFFSGRPVDELFLERLPATIQLMLPALVLAVVIGIPTGLIAAVNRNTLLDRTLMSATFVSQATPSFVLGIILILIFSLMLKLLPSGGIGSWQHHVMPVLTLGTLTAASIARLTRSSMLDVLQRPFVAFARAKGLRPLTVILKHGLRNALLPVVTIIGLEVGTMIGGTVVIETVFSWPGAGRLLVDAVLKGDYPVLQFGVMTVAVAVVITNLSVDSTYSLLDPRIRRGSSA